MPNDDNPTPDPSEPTRKRGRRPVTSRSPTFAANLKHLRARDGLTQEQLNEALELPDGTVKGWEQSLRPPSLEDLKDVAAYFDVSTDDLLDPSPTFTPPGDPPSEIWRRFILDLLAQYPSRVEIKEINFWAGNQTANIHPPGRAED